MKRPPQVSEMPIPDMSCQDWADYALKVNLYANHLEDTVIKALTAERDRLREEVDEGFAAIRDIGLSWEGEKSLATMIKAVAITLESEYRLQQEGGE